MVTYNPFISSASVVADLWRAHTSCIRPQALLPAIMLLAVLAPGTAFPQEEEDLQWLIFEAAERPPADQNTPLPSSVASTAPAAGATPVAPAPQSAVPPNPANPVPGLSLPPAATAGAEPAAADDEQALSAGLQADIERYRRQIAESGNLDDLYSSNLREQHEALAGLLQQSGDHAAAITELENAMHIERVNEGLFTLDQIPLVEKIIASHTSLGNFQEVNDYHEYLYYIQLKSFASDDPRLLAAKEEWADWNVESYLKEGLDLPGGGGFSFSTSAGVSSANDYVAIQNPRNGSFNYVPRSQLPFILNPQGIATNATVNDLYMSSTQFAVPAERLVDERLRRAQDLYEEIIEIQTEEATSTGTVEHKLANIAFAIKKLMDEVESQTSIGSLGYNRILQPRSTPMIVSRGYRQSMEALEAIAVELERQLEEDPSGNPVQAAQAYIYLGDWHLSFDRASRSEDAYTKAWEILQAHGVDEAGITALFAPKPLVPLPAFAIHDYSRTLYGISERQEIAYKGYIDLTLDVDRFGNVRGIDMEGGSPDASQTLRGILQDYLRDQKMRPAVVDGKTVERSGLNIRYYFSY